MNYQLRVTRLADLPRLGWIAEIVPEQHVVRVRVGPCVESAEHFIVEGVWDGPFSAGRFDQSAAFFGSGLRLDADALCIVPSRAPIDRVCYAYHRDRIVVAERAPQLPAPPSYDDYRARLDAILQSLGDNWRDPGRRTAMDAYATVSSGYDGAAVAAMVRAAGVKTCFSAKRSNSIVPRWLDPDLADDDGTPVATALGMETLPLEPPSAKVASDTELLFLAGNRANPELTFASMAETIQRSGKTGVAFTGYFGDALWSRSAEPQYLDGRFTRSDSAGLGLCEARVFTGFIHVPLPMMFGHHIGAMIDISNRPEMQPWTLGTTSYDRPVPRRILETAGVPRHLFGRKKKAVVKRYDFPYNRVLRRQFYRDLGVPVAYARTVWGINEVAYRCRRLWVYLRVLGDRQKALGVGRGDQRWIKTCDFRLRMYLMASRILSERLSGVLAQEGR